MQAPSLKTIGSLAGWAAVLLGGGATGIGGIAGLAFGARKIIGLWQAGRPISAAVAAAKGVGPAREVAHQIHVDVAGLADRLRPLLSGRAAQSPPVQTYSQESPEPVVVSPPQQVTVREQTFVNVPLPETEGEAYAKAISELAQRYPGRRDEFAQIESLKNQIHHGMKVAERQNRST